MMNIPKIFKRSCCNNTKKIMQKERMHFLFMRGAEEVRDSNNSWLWLKKGYLKKTERLKMAAQDQ